MHLTPACEALLAGQAQAREQNQTIHAPYLSPVNLARRSGGFDSSRRERCKHCWSSSRPHVEQDSADLLAEFAARPYLAAMAQEAERQAAEEAGKQDLAARAARSIAQVHGLDAAQEAVARKLVRMNWLGDREPGSHKLTRDEIAAASRGR